MLFHKIFIFLGFPSQDMSDLLNIAYNKSLFFGKQQNSDHIRSGKVKQWKQYFNPNHKIRFLELFNNVLIKLGYEKNNSW